jgi:methylsterol monooxygenase
MVMNVIQTILFNQGLSLFFWIVLYPLAQWRQVSCFLPLPSFTIFVRDIFLFLCIEEPLFYFSHRLLHTRYLYNRIHSIHHRFITPIAVAAIYAHPIEHIIANLLPVFAGPLIFGSHLSVITIWQVIATLSAVNTHCGYHLPFFPSPQAHDYHHKVFTANYGVMGLCDYLFGTDALFRKSQFYPYHRTYFSLDAYTPGIDHRQRMQSKHMDEKENDTGKEYQNESYVGDDNNEDGRISNKPILGSM